MTSGFERDFTVLMAVYGGDDPRLFEMAMKSILDNGLLPNKIVLVVDGPLTPDLDSLVQAMSNNASIFVHRLAENVGLSQALNAGLKFVETSWVVRADSDDFNLTDRFKVMSDWLEEAQGELDLFGSAIREVDREGNELALRRTAQTHNEIRAFARKRNPFNHMSIAMRTSMVLDVGGYPNVYLKEDYALWASMLARGARTSNIYDVLVEATAGTEMYNRRGGLKYALAELKLQKHLVANGIKGPVMGAFHGCLRSIVFLAPSRIRSLIYLTLLRQKTGPDNVN